MRHIPHIFPEIVLIVLVIHNGPEVIHFRGRIHGALHLVLDALQGVIVPLGMRSGQCIDDCLRIQQASRGPTPETRSVGGNKLGLCQNRRGPPNWWLCYWFPLNTTTTRAPSKNQTHAQRWTFPQSPASAAAHNTIAITDRKDMSSPRKWVRCVLSLPNEPATHDL